MFMRVFLCSFLMVLMLSSQAAQAGEDSLTIARQTVNVTGHPVQKLTINGTTPGPTLHFKEGEDVTVHVTNTMSVPTSIHWHGFLIDPAMDGVPGMNGFKGILPGQSFTYHFKIRQSGTYWYHSHSQFQEQDGLYGAIVIEPKTPDSVKADRDYVVVLSDFSDENGRDIMGNLKMMSDYYNYARVTVDDFWEDAKRQGFSKAWDNMSMWNQMRMSPSDLSDVSGYTFLINGKTAAQNWTGLFKPGERVRLRFINASAMSFYDVRIPGLKMQVVSADGQNVEPVPVDEFRFGVAETYDVIVTPKEDKAYTIAAEPIDRTGFAIGTLSPREGMTGDMPAPRCRAQLTMADMGMGHMGHDMRGMSHMEHNMSSMDHDMSSMDMSGMDMESGWAQAGTPEGDKALSYSDLRYRGTQKDTRAPERTIEVRLGGNMERYIWTMNGKRYQDSGPMKLRYGERVRLKFVNETMMAHPMHLHGMFVQLENGQPIDKLPNKHTVIVPPGGSYSVLLTADEAGEWAFHCHLLYHMAAGMMTKVVVAKLDEADIPPDKRGASSHMDMDMDHDMTDGHHHAH
ncbi:MAG: copper resistance system multicopper oxidase [Alphaproteobacteria bacterium]|nr:copper resistance system multicopper oxidase [Alphaproteobacteria bacterium]